jgi:dTDP-glucose pyrophosphorylase
MAKAKAVKKVLDSYTVKGTHKVVKGMYVFIKRIISFVRNYGPKHHGHLELRRK